MHYNFNSKLGMNILRTKWIKQERDKKKVTPALSADWVHFSLVISKTNTVSWPWCYSFEFISWSYNEQVEPPGTTAPHESTYLTPWPLEEHKTSTISSHFSCSGLNWPSPESVFWAPSFLFTLGHISSIFGTSSLMYECYNSFWVDAKIIVSYKIPIIGK